MKNEGIPGTHCDTMINFIKCNFTWTIHQFPFMADRRETLKSSTFSAIGDDFLWYLQLSYTAENRLSVSDRDLVNISVNGDFDCIRKYGPITGDVEISILKSDRSQIGNKTSKIKLIPGGNFQCCINSIARISEITPWLFQNGLTIVCKLNYCKKSDIVSVISTPSDSNLTASYGPCLSCDMEEILTEGYFSDVTISVKGKNYPAHKAILSSRCSVFKSMFRSDMQETKQNQIVITDIEPETFEEMLHYIYTNKAKNLEKYAYELLPVADKYDLAGLRTLCEEVLLSKLSTDNVAKMLVLADMHHVEELKAHSLRLIKVMNASCKEFKSTEVWNILTASRPQLMKDLLDVFFDE